MINVGVLGLGMMGLTHLDVYAKRPDVRVVAISDKMPDRLSGKMRAAGNVKGQAQGEFDFSAARKYTEGMDLIRDPEVQLIDVCLPTPMHREYGLAALATGKHVLMEKPLARTYADARQLAEAADKAKGFSMIAMCMRFWPGWDWLKDAIDAKTYGEVLAAHFRRVAPHPGGAFYSNGALSGGAALDLHIHDTDFINWVFGLPASVRSVGYSKITSEVDHLITTYHYPGIPLVTAEGSWAMTDGFPFNMQYTVNFERATAVFDLAAEKKLMLYEAGQSAREVEVSAEMGYAREIGYFLDCIKENRRPTKVTLHDGAAAIRVVEAEVKSVRSGEMAAV